ncbi:hypothetical protein pb186bvf_018183 [Paramecium bursaria]
MNRDEVIVAGVAGAAKANQMATDLTKKGGKLDETEQLVNKEVDQAKQLLSIQGNPNQVAQQNSLYVAAAQLILASFISMLFVQLGFIGTILVWIPLLDTLTVITYILTIVVVQFAPNSVNEKPLNFGVGILHTCSKVLLLVYTTIWYESLRCELYQLLYGLILIYILNVIKSAIVKSEPVNLKVKSNALTIMIVSFSIGGYLCLLARTNFFFILLAGGTGALYSYILLLSLQRFEEHEYLTRNMNDIYLGSAQLDADFLISCKLFAYHMFEKSKGAYNEIKEKVQEKAGKLDFSDLDKKAQESLNQPGGAQIDIQNNPNAGQPAQPAQPSH